MWVVFLAAYDWNVPERRGRVTITFKPGKAVLVRKVCADAAISKGRARPATESEKDASRKALLLVRV